MSRKKPLSQRSSHDHRPPLPEIPPEVDELRRLRDVVDPSRVYRIALPDGSVLSYRGRDLIETADAFTALADAQRAGDEAGMRDALKRIDALA